MGLMQKALETYDAMERLAGIYVEGKEPLAPVGHIVTKAQLEITIDADGQFVSARAADKDMKIIIPVTEESSGRTSSPAAHPLCEQLGYLLGQDEIKLSLYRQGLERWVQSEYSHPKAAAVLRYICSGTLREDLAAAGLSAEKEKDLVCWRVVGCGIDDNPAVWRDVSLMRAYTAWYLSQRQGDRQLCMLTGEEGIITWQHLKGAFSLNGNAKIISANDSSNFTYRGRFAEPEEAASVSYIASQKAHNALKWLISTQGVIQGGRAFVAWNPRGKMIPRPTLPLFSLSEEAPALPTYKSYRSDLHKKLEGYHAELDVSNQVVIAAFDAATTGRLAITYYNELLGSDFLDRLADWEESCCWPFSYRSISSPSLSSIIDFAFGTPRGTPETVKADEAVIPGNMQRLLSCRIDQAVFPLDIMRALVTRAGNLQLYSDANRRKLLHTACAVIRKYTIDHHKEAFDLALEPERKDRSYQWGRLLAVMERIEETAYWNKARQSDDGKAKERLTTAIRMQAAFIQRPGVIAALINERLHSAYYQDLRGDQRNYFDRLLGEIMAQIQASCEKPEDYGKPLTEAYLPGYYLQRNAFHTGRPNNNEEAEEE